MTPVYRSFIKDNSLVFGSHLLVYAQTLILIPLIIKTVGVSVYGGFVLVVSLIGFTFGISSFGVELKYKRYLPSTTEKEARQRLFYPQIIFHLGSLFFLTAVFIFFSSEIKRAFLKGMEISLFLPGMLLLATFLQAQSTDYFRYTGRVKQFIYGTVTPPYLHIGIVLTAYFLFHRLNVNFLIFSQALSLLLVSSPLFFMLLKEIGLTVPKLDFVAIGADIKIGFPLVMLYVVDFILSGSSRYIIAFYMSLGQVGYYVPAYVIGSLCTIIPKVSGVVLPPLLSGSVDRGKEQEAQTMLNYTIKAFLLASIPFVVGSLVLGRSSLALFASKEVADNAFFVIPIVALGTIFYGLNIILSNVLFVRLKTKMLFASNAMAALMNLVFNLIFLFIFKNIVVAAISALVSYFSAFLLIRTKVAEDWPISFDFPAVAKSISAALIMGVLLYGGRIFFNLQEEKLPQLILEIFVGVISYLLLLYEFRVFSQKEKLFLKKLWQ